MAAGVAFPAAATESEPALNLSRPSDIIAGASFPAGREGVGVGPLFFVAGGHRGAWRAADAPEKRDETEMTRRTVDRALERELAAVADSVGCELVHAHFAGGTLRLVLDRPEGVTLKDCEAVSRQVSPLLDTLDFGGGGYVLEVSSPGLDRQLYRREDYERFAGRRARVTYRTEHEGGKRTVIGTLADFDAEGDAVVRLESEETGEPLEIPLNDILVARLEIEL